jgi:hypothetical protein
LLSGISQEQIRELAKELGFTQRNSTKFDPMVFLAVVCLKSQLGSPSYNDLAAKIEANFGVSFSKQALWKRVNNSCVLFFQAILAMAIKNRFSQSEIDNISSENMYSRIVIQDSTIIKVPKKLFDIFSGVSNAHGSVCNVRIQGVYELISGRFIDFSIDSYSRNDQESAPELKICKSDLVLRDRGYMTYNEIERHTRSGADCIFRHKMKYVYLDPESGIPINLTSLLRKNKPLDIVVCLNNKQRTKVRLLAEPVSDQIANERRRKAKVEMRGHNPSKELLELMGYTIYITTIMDKEVNLIQIKKFYSLRWKIEIIFKIWKSYLNFDNVHNVSNNQLWVLFLARFIMIVLSTHFLYVPYSNMVMKHCHNRALSMMKFFKYINNDQKVIRYLAKGLGKNIIYNKNTLDNLVRYCAYDKRKRMNIIDLEKQLLLS